MQVEKELGSHIAAICRAICRDDEYSFSVTCVKQYREEILRYLEGLRQRLREELRDTKHMIRAIAR